MTPLRVLVIEDSPADAQLVVAALEHAGYRLDSLRVDSSAALAAALARPWDVAICDFHIPGFGALPALAMLAADGAPPCVVVSGAMSPQDAAVVLRAGAREVVGKDSLSRLPSAVLRCLRRR